MNQSTLSVTEMEALFQQAAASEPDLTDSNFTKTVMNSLPRKVVTKPARQWLPDAIGIFVSVFAIWMMADPVELLSSIPTEFPASVVVSMPNVLLVSGTLVMTALLGWYIVERDF